MFNKIIYINLDRRPDRNKNILDEINKINFDGPIERISGIDGSKVSLDDLQNNFTKKAILEARSDLEGTAGNKMTFGAMGLALTYKNILTQILNDNYEYTLILEDDAKFVDNFLEKINNFLNHIPEYDLLYPGYHNGEGHDEGTYAKVYKVWGTHSLIVNKKAAKEILKIFPLDKQFDTEISRSFKNLNVFATKFYEKLIWTPNDDSDIQPQIIESFNNKQINVTVSEVDAYETTTLNFAFI